MQVNNIGDFSVDLTALTDNIYGNLHNQGTCVVPQTIAASGSYSCSFSADVNGNAGDSETDTVTATAEDDDGNSVQASDSATVSISGTDFGDAPDPTYPTLLANDGARHILGSGIFLGAGVDAEADGQPDATSTGDDLDGNDDEDGVIFAALVQGASTTLDVVASQNCVLNAWIDFNANGSWLDVDEQIFSDQALAAGNNAGLAYTVPAGAVLGTTAARLRCTPILACCRPARPATAKWRTMRSLSLSRSV